MVNHSMTGSEVLAHGLLARGYLAGVAVRESVAIRRPCNPVYCDKYSAGPYSKGRNYWMGVGGAEYTHSPAAPTLLYTRDHESCTSAEASSVVRWEGCAGMKNLGSTYHPPIRTAKSAGTENMTRQGWSNVWAWPWSHGLTVSPHAAWKQPKPGGSSTTSTGASEVSMFNVYRPQAPYRLQ